MLSCLESVLFPSGWLLIGPVLVSWAALGFLLRLDRFSDAEDSTIALRVCCSPAATVVVVRSPRSSTWEVGMILSLMPRPACTGSSEAAMKSTLISAVSLSWFFTDMEDRLLNDITLLLSAATAMEWDRCSRVISSFCCLRMRSDDSSDIFTAS